MMGPEWREKRVYPLLGGLLLLSLLFLNFRDSLPFPTRLWQPEMGFVSTNSTRFVDTNGEAEEAPPMYVNGWNSYWLLQESAWGSSRWKASKMLGEGARMGLTVCRTWAFSDGPGPGALQMAPGVFNERVFQGLDFVIVEARKHRIRLILSLVNNLDAFGGKAQYIRWAQEAGVNVTSSSDSFFSSSAIKDYYKAYVKAIISRKNTFSGVRYRDEPAIFAWEIMNEPRGESASSAPLLQAWIIEMAAFIKSLDTNHLVTVGLEGFYGRNSTEAITVNPGAWAASLGTDFIGNSAVDNIDFASVHAYPDSWLANADLEAKDKYLSLWVNSHITDGDTLLKKPILFTEVGSIWSHRDVLLKTVYDKIYESSKKRQAGAGALVWQLLVEGVEDYSDQFSFVPWNHPSTYLLIKQQSCKLHNVSLDEQHIASCSGSL